ncbi:MAG: nucleotidyltransferase substrate binding protein [Spirochaetia bacterium]
METKLDLLTKQLNFALIDYKKSLEINITDYSDTVADVIKNGQIQKFEFSIELVWKTLKQFLFDVHGIESVSPKQTIRSYFELGFCSYNECEELLEAINMRNRLSHVYKKSLLESVHNSLEEYSELFQSLYIKKPW